MVDKETIKDVWKAAQKDRYKNISTWVFDRWIFSLSMVLCFGWLLFVAWSYDFELDYYECIEATPYYSSGVNCDNPFYKPITWKNAETLPPGEYGQKPGPLFKSVYYIPAVLLFLASLINYLIYNKRAIK